MNMGNLLFDQIHARCQSKKILVIFHSLLEDAVQNFLYLVLPLVVK